MLKKIYKVLFLFFAFALLVGCKPSDKYVGDWYALSGLGEEVMINFSKEKTMTITSHRDEDEIHEINKTEKAIKNNIRYLKIKRKVKNNNIDFKITKNED